MPRLPHETFPGGRIKNIINEIPNKIYKYNIFAIIIIEVLSLFLVDCKEYVNFYYPLLSQLLLFTLVFTIYHKAKYLKFCVRKIWAYRFLMYYFGFGFITALFSFSESFYIEVINKGLLIIVVLLTFLSLAKDE